MQNQIYVVGFSQQFSSIAALKTGRLLRLADYYLCSPLALNSFLHQIGLPPTSQWRARSLEISPPKEICSFHYPFLAVSSWVVLVLPVLLFQCVCLPLYWPHTMCPQGTAASHPPTTCHPLTHCPTLSAPGHSPLIPQSRVSYKEVCGPSTYYSQTACLKCRFMGPWIQPSRILRPTFITSKYPSEFLCVHAHTHTRTRNIKTIFFFFFFYQTIHSYPETCHTP